ncbi:MAG: asparagine synthase (glutamine-hydrolyzing) [Chitinophagales bacterium]|jgi:asparagine synthase (glutamine-hydrolysing)|nr:asparagine synthase (glutamine-hydrolyzing) [Chitinophagales bacterium]
MCGIAGYFSGELNHHLADVLPLAIKKLNKRGPDFQQTKICSNKIGLAHARLSIIDTSAIAHQPMSDSTGRFTIVFNGEIFNYRELKATYLTGMAFQSNSDTEVLLQLYIKLGEQCLPLLNGFFAFAIYDSANEELFLARDRFGIKPLVIYRGDSFIAFASEMKALYKFPCARIIDYNVLALYLQLNYIPPQCSILKDFQKLGPGCFARVSKEGSLNISTWYSLPYKPGTIIESKNFDYDKSKQKLKQLVHESVERRLVSDVPLGTFLSGGIDSSIVTACAAGKVNSLNTFSIGFKDEPYFDETRYANLVAKKFGTNHTVFSISNDEMFENIFSILDYIDEPFADSSSIAVYILSQKTRQNVTVALSGDGGDELFAGYNKHKAELQARKDSVINKVVELGLPIISKLPKSRHGKLGNLFRQLQRFGEGVSMSNADRYWRWCSFNSASTALQLLNEKIAPKADEIQNSNRFIQDWITKSGDLNDVLFADTQLVLPGDMLTKVDYMSMANSLEVRVPLLDYTIVDFAFSLPVNFKIDKNGGKKILKETFRKDLPDELYTRPKRGFEVPLLKWMKTGLHDLIENELLNDQFIIEQGIFSTSAIRSLKQKLNSNNPEDVHATLWGLLVFQYWWKQTFVSN